MKRFCSSGPISGFAIILVADSLAISATDASPFARPVPWPQAVANLPVTKAALIKGGSGKVIN